MTEDTHAHKCRCRNPLHDHRAPTLADLIDTEHPAFLTITDVLSEFRDAGVDFTAESVTIAIKLGHLRHQRAQGPDEAEPMALTTRRSNKSAGPVVYYVRRSHLIKIGTTTNLHDRMHVLMPDEILAVEPGGRELEKERHQQFADLRIGKLSEHFYPGRELKEHIAKVRAEHGRPDPRLPSIERVARRRRAKAEA